MLLMPFMPFHLVSLQLLDKSKGRLGISKESSRIFIAFHYRLVKRTP